MPPIIQVSAFKGKEFLMVVSLHSTESKDLIITNMLKYVPHYGWSTLALEKAIVDTGFQASDAEKVFLGNIERTVEHYFDMMDRKMEERLATIDFSSMKIRDRITCAVMVRLRLLEDHKEAVKKTTAYLAKPQHATLGTRSLYQTVNAIWYAAGDTATDFNFYTKRAILAGVYSTTFIYWLNDSSGSFEKTEYFLKQRIQQVMAIPQAKQHVKQALSMVCKPFEFFKKSA